ncbi:hypothetical protein [Ekhidna sp. To15]|uniref:hypothetical protein n=1 Tax=Ekhidna sp. To15 TaxID=3395267 RepID=UPI003F525A38
MGNKHKKGFTPDYYLVNDVLMEYNPLGVEGPVLSTEYVRYIPGIISVKNDKKKLFDHIKNLLVELDVIDLNDDFHKEYLEKICSDLMRI